MKLTEEILPLLIAFDIGNSRIKVQANGHFKAFPYKDLAEDCCKENFIAIEKTKDDAFGSDAYHDRHVNIAGSIVSFIDECFSSNDHISINEHISIHHGLKPDYIPDYTPDHKSELIMTFLISSVNPCGTELCLESIRQFGNSNVLFVDDLLTKQKLIDFNRVKGIGSDRMLGLLGAFRSFDPPFVTVDCGTAVTVNFCQPYTYNKKISSGYQAKCIGGAIFAGIHTQLNALKSSTANLFTFENPDLSSQTGLNTKQALSIGVVKSVVGGCARIIADVFGNDNNHPNVPVIFTGGDANVVFNIFKVNHPNSYYIENLVLQGMLAIAE